MYMCIRLIDNTNKGQNDSLRESPEIIRDASAKTARKNVGLPARKLPDLHPLALRRSTRPARACARSLRGASRDTLI